MPDKMQGTAARNIDHMTIDTPVYPGRPYPILIIPTNYHQHLILVINLSF